MIQMISVTDFPKLYVAELPTRKSFIKDNLVRIDRAVVDVLNFCKVVEN